MLASGLKISPAEDSTSWEQTIRRYLGTSKTETPAVLSIKLGAGGHVLEIVPKKGKVMINLHAAEQITYQ